jgi:peptide/nickel transport system ATP-binding protein
MTAMSIMRLIPTPPGKIVEGEVLFESVDLLSLSESEMESIRGNKISMVFQEPMTSLNPVLTIGRQLTESLEIHLKMTSRQATKRAAELLKKVGIPDAERRLKDYPHQYSGGMRQRLMIAIAMSCNPRLIIADEPTTALDVTIQAQILHLLADLQREFQTGLILITHDLGVVARVADRVAVMYAGQIVEQGTAMQIFQSPTHPYTQGLLDCIPIPGKTARGAHLGSIPGIVPSLVGRIKGCHFAERCRYARNLCQGGAIGLRDGAMPGHRYRCIQSPAEAAAHLRPETVQ